MMIHYWLYFLCWERKYFYRHVPGFIRISYFIEKYNKPFRLFRCIPTSIGKPDTEVSGKIVNSIQSYGNNFQRDGFPYLWQQEFDFNGLNRNNYSIKSISIDGIGGSINYIPSYLRSKYIQLWHDFRHRSRIKKYNVWCIDNFFFLISFLLFFYFLPKMKE